MRLLAGSEMRSEQAQTARTRGASVVPLPLAERRPENEPPVKDGKDGPRSATIRLELERGPTAASEARAALALLDGCAHEDLLDDVQLLVSEVVTNAVRHARGVLAESPVELGVAARWDRVRVVVADGGRGFKPQPRTEGQSEASGWGLHLVDRLATRRGVDRD